MLSSAQLTAMRAVQADTFDLSAAITRRAVSQPTTGRTSQTPSTVATVACRVAPGKASDRERIEAGRVVSGTIWRVTVPATTDVRIDDALMVSGRTFEVVAVWGAESRETARVCLCVER